MLNYALDQALVHGKMECAKYLVSIGCKFHDTSPKNVREACLKGSYESVEFIVSRGADTQHIKPDTLKKLLKKSKKTAYRELAKLKEHQDHSLIT